MTILLVKNYIPFTRISLDHNSMVPIQIIGVIKDFHFESLRQNIGPLCMRLGNSTGLPSFKITTANMQPI